MEAARTKIALFPPLRARQKLKKDDPPVQTPYGPRTVPLESELIKLGEKTTLSTIPKSQDRLFEGSVQLILWHSCAAKLSQDQLEMGLQSTFPTISDEIARKRLNETNLKLALIRSVQIPALDDAISDFILHKELGVDLLPEISFEDLFDSIVYLQAKIGDELRKPSAEEQKPATNEEKQPVNGEDKQPASGEE